MRQSHTSKLDLSQIPKVVCALDLETTGKDVNRAELAVAGLKVYTWDVQRESHLPGPYEHYAPTDLPALQQRLDELPGPIIGHNIFGFDYQVLRRYLNVEHLIEKSADTLHFLYEQDGGGEDGTRYSLDQLAKENLGEGKKAKAKTIPKLIKEGKLDEVLAYNERDCDLSFRIWWKMVSERHISAGEAWDDDGEFFEVTYNLGEKDINVLTCATPRFTYTAWATQLERDGWIVMPPQEVKRREKERERQRKEAWEAARTREQAMREFIAQHLRDDIPRKFADIPPSGFLEDPDGPQASFRLEEARALLMRAGLPKSVWAEEVVRQLLRGRFVHPARLVIAGRPDDLEGRAETMKSILAALAADGYTPHYHADSEPDGDAISLDGPPPTFAEQHVIRMQERYDELEAMYPDDPNIQVLRLPLAEDFHFAYTRAMRGLRGDGYIVFQDGSYVLDIDEIDLFELQPKVLTSEERTALDAYIQDHPNECTEPSTSEARADLEASIGEVENMELYMNAMFRKGHHHQNPLDGKLIINLKWPAEQDGKDETTIAASPNVIQGHTLTTGDYIIYRIGEPTPANPDAPAQPVLEKKSGIPMLGYVGEVIDFTDTRIVIWSSWENARYHVRPSDVVLIGKEKRGTNTA